MKCSSIFRCAGVFVLSVGFLGFLPMMHGTVASLVSALLIVSTLPVLPEGQPQTFVIVGGSFLLLSALSAVLMRLCIRDGDYNKSYVVIDELLGTLVAFSPAFIFDSFPWYLMVLAFGLYRFFDIVKPAGVRFFSRKKSPETVLADDMIAGIYAALIVSFAAIFLRF